MLNKVNTIVKQLFNGMFFTSLAPDGNMIYDIQIPVYTLLTNMTNERSFVYLVKSIKLNSLFRPKWNASYYIHIMYTIRKSYIKSYVLFQKKIKNLIFNITKGEILIHIKMENRKILFITIMAMALSILVVESRSKSEKSNTCIHELDSCNREYFWSFFGYPTCVKKCLSRGIDESKCIYDLTKKSNYCMCFYKC